jgi:hypothetical protein
MAMPLQKLHIDKMLTNISIGYKNEAYIADQIFLPVVVEKQSDKYYVYGKELFRTHDDKRAPGTEAHEITWTLSDDQYFVEGHAIRHPIADEELQNADDVFQLEADGTELVSEAILLNKEVAAAQMLLDASNYGVGFSYNMGAASNPPKWSDFDNSNPVIDIESARAKMHKQSGIVPNTLIISRTVYNVLKFHPKLLEIIKYVERGMVTLELMKAAFDVDNIIVGNALVSSSHNPAQGDNLGYIWGNSAILAYIPKNPGKKTLALGYSFMWNKDGAGAVQVRKWYEQGRRATVVEAERWYAHKIVSNVAGFLFANAVDPIMA